MVALSGKVMLLIGLAVVIVVGAILGIYFGTKGHSDSSGGKDDSGSSGSGSHSSGDHSGSGSDGDHTPKPKPTSITDRLGDPKDAEYEFNFFHISDAGATASTYKGKSSCCDVYHDVPDKNSKQYKMDENAQVSVAALMGYTAEKSKPEFIVNGGDNFYWNGIYSKEQKYRFDDTFTGKYNQASISGVDWYSVLGNHDYGGEAFICGDHEDSTQECGSIDEMKASLKDKYTQQMNPSVGVWQMAPASQLSSSANGYPNFFHKNTFEKNGVSVEVYHVDTGYAVVHGAPETCCQCFGYASAKGEDPGQVCKSDAGKKGGQYCAPEPMYNECINWFNGVSENSLNSMIDALKESKATFKIINSHYAPQLHFSPQQRKEYYDAMKDNDVQLLVAGHTHAMFHDYVNSTNTHMIVNGVGGGIQSQSATTPGPESDAESVWMAQGNPYGFVNFAVSKNWLRMDFTTFASDQQFSATPSVSDNKVIHSYYIPVTGEAGIDALESDK